MGLTTFPNDPAAVKQSMGTYPDQIAELALAAWRILFLIDYSFRGAVQKAPLTLFDKLPKETIYENRHSF